MVRNRLLSDPVRGQGLGWTRKYGVAGVQTDEGIITKLEYFKDRWLNWVFSIFLQE